MQELWRDRLETLRSALSKSLNGIASKPSGKLADPLKGPSRGKEPTDRRRSRRMDMDHNVSFWSEDMEPCSAHLINMSRDGLFLETDAKLENGQVMKIRLPAMSKGHFPGITTGQVVRLSAHGVGVRRL